MSDVYVVDCCRTAIGAFGKSLAGIPAPELGAVTVRETLHRSGINPSHVDEVYFGCVLAAGLGQNVARQVSIGAGIPVDVPATTVNMVCGSGMKAVLDATRAIRSGDADIVVAGGCENMSAAPYIVSGMRWGARMNDVKMIDSMVHDGLWDAFEDYHMGETAENICDRWELSRENLDAFAYASQRKAKQAVESGIFKEEIVPVKIKGKRETVVFDTDEYLRDTSMESLGKLKPSFRKDGRVTAGNASGLNDGAAALVLVSQHALHKYKLNPMAVIKGWGQSGTDPVIMGIGPVEATKRALRKADLTVADLDRIEANEAFAAQSLAVARELGFDMERVNIHGGAIALGHPIGASGARIIVTLLHEMRRNADAFTGLATLCIGGGMGIAIVFQKV